MSGWLVGLADYKDDSATLELGLGLSLAKIMAEIVATNVVDSRPPNGDQLQHRTLVPINFHLITPGGYCWFFVCGWVIRLFVKSFSCQTKLQVRLMFCCIWVGVVTTFPVGGWFNQARIKKTQPFLRWGLSWAWQKNKGVEGGLNNTKTRLRSEVFSFESLWIWIKEFRLENLGLVISKYNQTKPWLNYSLKILVPNKLWVQIYFLIKK